MLRFETARTGEPCASYNGRYLHSRYAPRREAERYFDRHRPEKEPSVLLLLEPGCGYLSELSAAAFPGTTLIELHCRSEFDHRRHAGTGVQVWTPGHPSSLHDFLYRAIEDDQLADLRILAWDPAQRLFPHAYRELTEAVTGFISERNASLTTEGTFGPRWLHNMRINLRTAAPVLAPRPSRETPMVIAAPGPSLTRVLPSLRRVRSRYSLLALSSAHRILTQNGVERDLVLHTDGGHWATMHLSAAHPGSCYRAHPLSARPIPPAPYGGSSSPRGTLLISQGGAVEEYLLRLGGLQFMPLPAHGSVAGTALHLARRLSSAPIVFAGLDLAHHDIRSHAPGHSFDPLLMASAGRHRPIEQVYYERAARSGASTGRAAHSALSAYARWFSRISDREQLYILHSRPPSHALQSLEEGELESLLPHSPPPQLWSVENLEGRVPADRLLTALAEQIERESAPLLPGKAQIAEVRSYLTKHPLLKAFLELVDKPSVLKLLRRQRYGGDIEEPREELAEKVVRQLHRLRTPEIER